MMREGRESERKCKLKTNSPIIYRLPAFLLGLLDFFFPDPAASSVVPPPEEGMYPHSSNNRRAALLICLNLSALNGIPPYHLLLDEQKERKKKKIDRERDCVRRAGRCKSNVKEKRGRLVFFFFLLLFWAAFMFVVLCNVDVDVAFLLSVLL